MKNQEALREADYLLEKLEKKKKLFYSESLSREEDIKEF